MSTVCILTPIVIGSWPMITTAIVGAAGAMGFAVAGAEEAPAKATGKTKVEVEVPNSEVIAETLRRGEKVCIEREGVVIETGQGPEDRRRLRLTQGLANDPLLSIRGHAVQDYARKLQLGVGDDALHGGPSHVSGGPLHHAIRHFVPPNARPRSGNAPGKAS